MNAHLKPDGDDFKTMLRCIGLVVVIHLVIMFTAFFDDGMRLCEDAFCSPQQTGSLKGEAVILLHGIGRNARSMGSLARYFEKAGYHTICVAYPSTSATIESIAREYIAPAVSQCRGFRHIHFITHSMGGIVARQYLQHNSLPQGSRMVMLSPPNSGADLVEALKQYEFFEKVGPGARQLGKDEYSIIPSLKPLKLEVGVITGDLSLNPIFSSMLPGPDDGMVTVDGARLPEMKDFLVVPTDHIFIKRDFDVIRQTAHFIEYGSFRREQQERFDRFAGIFAPASNS